MPSELWPWLRQSWNTQDNSSMSTFTHYPDTSSSTMVQLSHLALRFSHRIYCVSFLHSISYINDTKTSGTPDAFFAQVSSDPSGNPADLSAPHWVKNSCLPQRAPSWVVSLHCLADQITWVRGKESTKKCHLAQLLFSAFPVILPSSLC